MKDEIGKWKDIDAFPRNASEGTAMKWCEMTLLQKVLFVVGLACLAGSAVLTIPLFWDVRLLPFSCVHILLGVTFLCLGLITNNKKYAKGQFIFAAVQFLFALLRLFLIELR